MPVLRDTALPCTGQLFAFLNSLPEDSAREYTETGQSRHVAGFARIQRKSEAS